MFSSWWPESLSDNSQDAETKSTSFRLCNTCSKEVKLQQNMPGEARFCVKSRASAKPSRSTQNKIECEQLVNENSAECSLGLETEENKPSLEKEHCKVVTLKIPLSVQNDSHSSHHSSLQPTDQLMNFHHRNQRFESSICKVKNSRRKALNSKCSDPGKPPALSKFVFQKFCAMIGVSHYIQCRKC